MMKHFLSVLLCSSIVFLSIDLYAYQRHTIASRIDTYIKGYEKQKLFNGSILIAQKGQVIFRKGCGMANYELNVKNTADTKFRLGSLSKQFTAFAIVQLEKNGLLSFDDTLDKYIPDYPRGSDIMIKQLLMHTSGIANFTSLPEFTRLHIFPATLDEIIATFKDKPLNFEPGLKYRYSNSGYVLLTDIIEKASGKSYEQYLHEHIFKPFGMHNSGYDRAEVILKNRASGYSLAARKDDASESEDDVIQNAPYVNMQVPAGAGALYSTVNDLFLWDRALHAGDKLINQLIESTININTDDEKCTVEYGYGVFVNSDSLAAHKKTISHHGSINGFATMMTHLVDDDIVIIVLSNFDFVNAGRLIRNIGDILFGDKPVIITEKRNKIFKIH